MLSVTLAFLPPVPIPNIYSSLLFCIPPPLQSSKFGHTFKAHNFLHKNSADSRNFPGIISSVRADTSNVANVSTSNENRADNFWDSQPMDQWVEPKVLAFWLKSRHRLKDVKMIHALVVKCLLDSVVFVNNNLISAYLRFGMLEEARKVFDKLPERSVVSWTSMLNGHLKFGSDDEVLSLLLEFLQTGVRANKETFVCMLNFCVKRLDFKLGRQIHACIVKGGRGNLITDSAIVHFYAQCGDFLGAFQAFDRMQEHDIISWTTMIATCSQHGRGRQAFSIFSKMLSGGYHPNEHTVCSVLKACGEEEELKFGRQLHAIVVKKLIRNDVFIGTSLLGMYARCRQILESRQVFDRMNKRNMITWTSIIAGYARNGHGYEALDLFKVMKRRKVRANALTIVSILGACGSIGALSLGKEIHAQIVKNCMHNNACVASTLVWLYCKCGKYTLASNVFREIPIKDVVSWTAIISGCAHLGYEFEALEFLKEMLGDGVEPNPFTYSSVLKACAKLEAIRHGKSVHSSVSKTPDSLNVFVGSALINMYAKFGHVAEAFQVFNGMQERNLFAWRSMIAGYARNGHCHEALMLMYRMQVEGFEVDDCVLKMVLSACGDVKWNMEPLSKNCLCPS
ncbi:hypothetical protein Nepgr_029252 [Nepenthes gracilis]|uniref:Pentatricopeptide repeat-containing protein n=1 Tax=Nepenthes gracilis TaxID=150966 RepID=A0AAD3TEB6_NEPGR|nr:hypothetical protein Nepgr_029252 [Nepenthes gracilis]